MYSGYSGYSGYQGLRRSKHYEGPINTMEKIKRDGGFWWYWGGKSGWSGYSGYSMKENIKRVAWYNSLWNFICKPFKRQS